MCCYVVATISAWPYAMWREGRPMAFKKTIEEAAFFGSYSVYMVKIFFTALWSDAFTYWKHYALHHPSIYAIHQAHHVFHNPSTFAGFAVHPVESFMTFCPILALCIPWANLYAPLHLAFIFSTVVQNLYMHCGYNIPILDNFLSYFYVNASVYHNKHHSL